MTIFMLAFVLALGASPPWLSVPPLPSAFQSKQGAPTQNPYTTDVRIDAKLAGEDFSPDGNLDKPVWKRAEWVSFDRDMSGAQHYADEQTRVAVLWSAKSIYFGFLCHYTVLNTYEGEDNSKERWELWNRDVAEVFLNPQPERVNHYFEFEVAPNNQWIDLEIDKDKTPFNDAAWNSGFGHATRIDQARRVWTCEVRIPVESMKVSAVPPDSEWRLNFYRAAGLGDDTKRHFMSWSTIPSGNTFHVPTRFGLVRFVK